MIEKYYENDSIDILYQIINLLIVTISAIFTISVLVYYKKNYRKLGFQISSRLICIIALQDLLICIIKFITQLTVIINNQ